MDTKILKTGLRKYVGSRLNNISMGLLEVFNYSINQEE